MEPRATAPEGRLAAITELAAADVPVGVMVAPIIPGLNDHETPAILRAAGQAGARFACFVMLRLPYAVGELFDAWLQRHYPERRDKVLSRVREMRGGVLNEARFGRRMRGEGPMAEQIKALFELSRRRAGINEHYPDLSTAGFRRPGGTQMRLFE
jgi:DNA repair photolyase